MKKLRLLIAAVTFGLFLVFATSTAWAAWYTATSPINNNTISNNVPTFTWNADTTGLTYNSICLWSGPNCPGSATYGCPWSPSLSDRSYTPSTSPVPLNGASSYSWVLYGCNSGCGTTAGTGCQNFQTPTQTPPTVTSTTISGGSCTFGTLASGLVSYWKLDDGTPGQTGIAATDSVDSNNGTATGTTVVGPAPVSKIGNARSFNGTNDYVAVGTGSSLSFDWSNPFSIGAWINTSDSGLYKYIYGKFTGDKGYGIRMDPSSGSPSVSKSFGLVMSEGTAGKYFWVRGTSRNLVGTGWHYVTATYNGNGGPSGITLYVDGTVEPSENASGISSSYGTMVNASAPTIGAGQRSYPSYYFHGTIDEVGVWNRALSATDVQSLYSSGSGQQYCTAQVSADGATIYNLTANASDNQGGTDIIRQFAMVNYGGAARGLVAWWDSTRSSNPWPNASTVVNNCALYTNSGTGYGYGNEYMSLVNCSTSTSGNNRTTTFQVKFNTNFIAPVANTLYGSATDTTNPQVAWAAGNSFNLATTTCNTAMPALSPPNSLGLVSWLRMNESSGAQVPDSVGANDGYAKNTLYNNLVSYWKMDDTSGTDSRGTNTGALSGSGCNFPVNSNYNNSIPGGLVSYWRLDESSGPTYADQMGINNGSTPLTCNFGNSLDNNIVSYWQMDEASGTTVTDKKDSNNGTTSGCTIANNDSLTSGLAGYWNLDETTGATAYDNTGFGSNGTISNATSVGGKINAGRSFVQSDTSEISAPIPSGLSNANVTVATWVYLDSTSKEGSFVKVGGPRDGFAIGVGCTDFNDTASGACYGNNLIVLFEYVRWINTGRAIGTGWHHVALTLDGAGTPTVYLDGVSVGSFGGTAANVPGSRDAGNTWIGGYDYSTFATFHRHPVATVDEVGIWKRALNGTEIQSLANAPTGTTCSASPTIAAGKINNARHFNGATDKISTTLNTLPTSTTDVTVGFWAKPTVNNTQNSIVFATPDEVTNRLNIHFPWSDSNIYWDFGNISGGGRLAVAFNPAWLNTWAYWTFTSQAGVGMKIYRNATVIGSNTTWSTFTRGTKTLFLSSYAANAGFWKGDLDEVGIWSRALTLPEIQTLYGGGTNPAKCKDLLGPTGGKINNAQTFDGTFDYLSIPTNSFPTGSNPRTITAWVWQNNTNSRYYVAGYGGSANNQEFRISLNEFSAGQFGLEVAGSGWMAAVPALTAGNWYHLAVTYTGSGAPTFYVNGVAYGVSSTWGTPSVNTITGGGVIGARGDLSFKLNGAVDEAAVWTRALSATEIANLYDKSGAVPPIVANPPACMPGPVIPPGGKVSNSLSFGGNDQILVPDSNTLDITSGFTLSTWFEASDLTGLHTILGKRNDAATNKANYALRTVNNQFDFYWWAGSAWQVYRTSNANLVTNTWYHVAVTYDNSTLPKIYLNGATTPLTGSCVAGTCNLAMLSDTNTFGIGRAGDFTGEKFVGFIDEVALWARVLAPSEINTVYNLGNSGISYDPNTSGGPAVVTGASRTDQDINNYPALSGTTLVPGKGRNFNGFNDYVTTGTVPVGLPSGSVMSVTAWVKPNATQADGTYNGIVRFGQGACNNTFLLSLQNSLKPSFAAFCNDFVPTTGNTPTLVANQWNHVAAVLSGTSITLYVNYDGTTNQQKISGTLSQVPNIQPTAAGSVLNIGSTDNPGRFFGGSIDEVRIYNKALSDSEVADEYKRTNIYPTGACGGQCDTGYFQPGYDRYCSPVNESCVPPNENTHIVGNVAGVPYNASGNQQIDVRVDITNNPSQPYVDIPGATNPKTYDFTVGKRSSYTLDIDPATLALAPGYTVNPQGYKMDLACASSYTGPTFWFNSDAGSAIQSTIGQASPVYYGSGKVSQSGSNLGYRLEQYSNDASTIKTSYGELYDAVARNSTLYNQDPCPSIGGQKNIGSYSFYCYDTATSGATSFETVLRTALTNGTGSIIVVMGAPGITWTSQLKTISSAALPIPSNKRVVVFVKGSLAISQPVTVPASSGLVVVLDSVAALDTRLAGNLYIDPSVGTTTDASACSNGTLDGLYVFPGLFSDVYTTNLNADTTKQLSGKGSIISLSAQPLGFGRNFNKALGPAEKFCYQPKYLDLYKNILSTPRYTWREIAPQ